MSKRSDERVPGVPTTGVSPLPVKIVIAGGTGSGKTTMVRAISDIEPLSTPLGGSPNADAPAGQSAAMDFGRVRLDDALMLYMFGVPEQERFGFMWDGLTTGAIGAVVLIDSLCIDDCYPAIDYFEHRGMPFVVAVNTPSGRAEPDLDGIRNFVNLADDTPIRAIDASDWQSVKHILLLALHRKRDLLTFARG